MSPTLGVLALATTDTAPRPPGAPGNPRTLPYPAVRQVVPGATPPRVLAGDAALAPAYAEQARALVAAGAAAITANCGFAIAYQDAVAAAVDAPVALSSVLLAPALLRALGPRRRIGLAVADAGRFAPALLSAAGVPSAVQARIDVVGLEGVAGVCAWNTRTEYATDWAALECDVVATVGAFADARPALGALLLECTGLVYCREALRRRTGLPAYDWVDLTDGLMAGVRERPAARG